MRRFIVLILAGIIVLNADIFSCTTFILRDGRNLYFGRNLDWITGTGLVMTNPRNLEKTSLADSSLKWVSKYGSVTFNQVGKELPYGGINEAGLVVEHMSYQGTQYPARDNRGALEPCQWIQFQLDNYATVEEVISSDKLVRIIDSPSKFHFLVCDSSGNSAVIEFINGDMLYFTGDELPFETLANSSYDESVESIIDESMAKSNPSLHNFTTAAEMINRYDALKENPADYSFGILKAVRQGPMTKWSIVYDISNMKIYLKVYETPLIIGENKIFRKQPGESRLKIIDVNKLSFNCNENSMILDMELDEEGEVFLHFIKYTTRENKIFIEKAFNFFKEWGSGPSLNEQEIEGLARFPESFRCAE